MAVSITLQLQPYSADPLFADTIALDSVSFDGVQTLNLGSQSTGAGAGKVTFNPVTVTKKYDAKSPALWSKMCSGTAFQKAKLLFTNPADHSTLLTVGYSLVAVQTVAINVASSDDGLKEVVSFQYGAITFTYPAQNPDGSLGAITVGWDRVRNVALNTPILLGP